MNAIRIPTFVLALVLLLLYWMYSYRFFPAEPLSIAVVILLPYLFLLVSHTPREIGAAFQDAFRRDDSEMPSERLTAGVLAMAALGRYSLALGVLGAFWSFIAAFNDVARAGETVKPQSMFPMLSQACFLVILGAALRWFLYGPMQVMLQAAMEPGED